MRISLFLTLLILAGCGNGKRVRSLEVSRGFLSASQPTMVYGKRLDGNDSFAIKLESSSTKIELPNGEWRFQAITWASAPKVMEGNPICAETISVLKSDSISVQLSMTDAGCETQNWMGSSGYYDTGTSLIFYGLSLNFCAPGSSAASLQAFADCTSYTSAVTGVQVILPDYSNDKTGTSGMKSACYPVSSTSVNISPKIPFGVNATFPVYSTLRTYYSSNSSCTGDGCCTGKVVNYDFPNGFSQGNTGINSATPTSSSSIKLKLEEKSSSNIYVYGAVSAAYQSCYPIYFDFRDGASSPLALSTATTVNYDCQGLCTFHTASDCSSAAISSAPFGVGATSSMLYVKQTDYTAKIKISTSNGTFVPGQMTVPSTVTFSAIDGNFLNKPAYLSALSSTYFMPPIVASKTVVYQTFEGNRGKMFINSVSTTSVTDDTFNFDFETYDSSGAIIASGTNQNITACFSGNCMLNLENNTPVFSGGGGNDAWFENLSGSLYFNPQGSASFFVLP